jgi:hypothetical protein
MVKKCLLVNKMFAGKKVYNSATKERRFLLPATKNQLLTTKFLKLFEKT